MAVVVALSLFLHAIVVYKAIAFFRTGGNCRESDKTVVATLAGLSVLLIVSQIMVWTDNPWGLINGSVGMSLLMAFHFANAFFCLAMIESLTDRRSCPLYPRG